jgi:chromate transporter
MRDEFVRRRGWLADDDFIDVLGASSLIPGPTSSELAMHIGHRRGGWPGFVVAGVAFILPAAVIVGILAWLYVEQGSRAEVGAVLTAVAPVVVAIIAHAGLGIARASVRTPLAVGLCGLAVVAVLLGAPEIAVLLGIGLLGLVVRAVLDVRADRRAVHGGAGHGDDGSRGPGAAAIGLVHFGPPGAPSSWSGASIVATVAATGAAVVAPMTVFLEMAKVGAVLFGSGYVLVALFESEFVDRLGWITQAQLVDAVAVGQATPGPLFSTATFVGYLVAGPAGAVAATVGIFLPAFIAVAISIPLLARLQRSARARAFLDGVNAATVGLLGVVAVQLAIGVLVDPLTIAIALAALVLLVRGVGSGVLIAAGAAVGLARLSLGV